MNKYNYSSEVIFSELLNISSNIIWKNPKMVNDYKNTEDSILIEQYILAKQGRLTFELIHEFAKEPLMEAGLSEEQALQAMDVPSSVPLDKRDLVETKQVAYIIDHYVETNDYYRMLNGQPMLSDTDIYNTKYPNISDDVTPIQNLSANALLSLEAVGYLDELISQYPDKKYLQHLTSKKIDIYVARYTSDYGLLYVPQSQYKKLINDFTETYRANRNMITKLFYSNIISENNSEYHGFIGMAILFSTINQMQRRILDSHLTRDFYDENTLQFIYDSYSIPFYKSLPMEYHTKIVKRINRLINSKGSVNVLLELFDIFNLSNMNIYEYYLLKIHKFENGHPVFVKDADGNYDYQKMYDVKFAKVKLGEDPSFQLTDSQNHVDYESVISNDHYWVNDSDLQKKLYSENYNFIKSKYMGISSTINLMKILYEASYYINLIVENQDELKNVTVYFSNADLNCRLIDLILYATCLDFTISGYESIIPTEPHVIGKVMGFNFQEDLETLINNIQKDDYMKNDAQLLNYLKQMNVYSLESVNTVYSNIVNLRGYLSDKMCNTDIPGEYFAYYELYQTLMYSEYTTDMFTKDDGSVATSVDELLQDKNSALYDRLQTLTDYSSELSSVLYVLENSSSNLQYLTQLNTHNSNSAIDYLMKFIEFFKSEKADLLSYELEYDLGYEIENMLKFMSEITIDEEYCQVNDNVDMMLAVIRREYESEKFSFSFKMIDDIFVNENTKEYVSDSFTTKDLLSRMEEFQTNLKSSISECLIDYMISEDENTRVDDYIGLTDNLKLIHETIVTE